MEAPEKIYISPNIFYIGGYDTKVLTTKHSDNVEYIRKDAIVAEIERELKSIINATNDFAEGRRMELNNLLSFIRSI